MSTKGEYRKGILTYYESDTRESHPIAPVVFYDDFLGSTGIMWTEAGSNGPWTIFDTSAAGNTVPNTPSVANGVARCPLDSTSEAQESGLYFGDVRPFVLNQGLVFECRLALQTLPTLLSEAVWGLAGDTNAVADSVAESIWFKADGSGAIVVESDDTTAGTTKDDISTGTTVTAGAFAIFRIDCTTIADVLFYMDGARVASGTTFDMSATAGLQLQPYFHIAKASGAGLGVMDVDYVKVWQKRS